jgi:hypothetical protein
MIDADVPPRKRVKIDCGTSKIAVTVPATSTVADACAAAEARLTSSLGKRRIRTFALPDTCELDPDDQVRDVVEDELLLAVFAEHDEVAPVVGGEDSQGRDSGAGIALADRYKLIPDDRLSDVFKASDTTQHAHAVHHLQSSLWFMSSFSSLRDSSLFWPLYAEIVKQKGQIDYLRNAVRALQANKTEILEQKKQIDGLRVTVQKLQTSVYSADQWLAPCACMRRG